MNRNLNEIPVDFSKLDIRFLPHYLTAERVRIEWIEKPHPKSIAAGNFTDFYVGIDFTMGCYRYTNMDFSDSHVDLLDGEASEYIEPHIIEFNRLPKKNSKYSYILESDMIANVIGLSFRNPTIPPEMSMHDLIKRQMNTFRSIRKMNPNWINCEEFDQAISEFKKEYLQQPSRR
jgi:hypothetical protein